MRNTKISIDNKMFERLKVELNGALMHAARAVDDKSAVTIAISIKFEAQDITTIAPDISDKLLYPIDFSIKINTKREIDSAKGQIGDLLIKSDINNVYAVSASSQITLDDILDELEEDDDDSENEET